MRYISKDCVRDSLDKPEPIDLNQLFQFLGNTPKEAVTLWTEGLRKRLEEAQKQGSEALDDLLNDHTMYDDYDTQADATAAFERMLDEEIGRIEVSSDKELAERCHAISSLDDWEPKRDS